MAVDVGEEEVAVGVAVGKFLAGEADEFEDGGVEVVDVDGVVGLPVCPEYSRAME